jgi:hypothetical protein
MSKKIIIIGSRRRDSKEDFQLVFDMFKEYYEDGDVIISGGCPKGGDKFAEIIAERMGLTEENGYLVIHRPERPTAGPKWEYAKAFYLRNTVVAKETEEDSVVIACVALDRTGGTEDTIRKIKRHNKMNYRNLKLV